MNYRLSTEATIGRILILVDIILLLVGIVLLIFGFGFIDSFGLGVSHGVALSVVVLLVIIALIGLIVSFEAYHKAKHGDFYNAGIYALVGSFLPPFRIITLIGAVLCLLSPEAKGLVPVKTVMKSMVASKRRAPARRRPTKRVARRPARRR